MNKSVHRSKFLYFLPVLFVLLSLFIFPAGAQAEDLIYDENGKALIMDTFLQVVYKEDARNMANFANENVSECYVPVRALAEYYGAIVDWQYPVVTVELEGKLITLEINSQKVTIREEEQESMVNLPNATYINQDNRLLVPLYFITDILGKEAAYYSVVGMQLGSPQYKVVYDERYDAYQWDVSDNYLPWQEMTVDEVAGFEAQFAKNNALSYDEIEHIVTEYLSYPLHFAIFDIYPGKYYNFDEKVSSDQALKNILYLSRSMQSDCYSNVIEVSSTNSVISGTFISDIRSGWYFLPLIYAAELAKQKDGTWLVTKLADPRLYFNVQSLKKSEPELYDTLLVLTNYQISIP